MGGSCTICGTKIAPRQVQLYTLAQVTAQPKHRGSEAHERGQKVLFSVDSFFVFFSKTNPKINTFIYICTKWDFYTTCLYVNDIKVDSSSWLHTAAECFPPSLSCGGKETVIFTTNTVQ